MADERNLRLSATFDGVTLVVAATPGWQQPPGDVKSNAFAAAAAGIFDNQVLGRSGQHSLVRASSTTAAAGDYLRVVDEFGALRQMVPLAAAVDLAPTVQYGPRDRVSLMTAGPRVVDLVVLDLDEAQLLEWWTRSSCVAGGGGGGGAGGFDFLQPVPAGLWHVPHNLNIPLGPVVQVRDLSGLVIVAQVQVVDANNVDVGPFVPPIAGSARCV